MDARTPERTSDRGDSKRGTIEDDPSFDRGWYAAQTAMQIVLALFLTAALAGLFGGGWLSETTVRVGSVDVSYERFARRTVPFRMKLRPVGALPAEITATVGQDLISRTAELQTTPTAAASRVTADGTSYIFASQSGRDGGEIVLAVKPDRLGWFEWSLTVNGATARLSQIIYP